MAIYQRCILQLKIMEDNDKTNLETEETIEIKKGGVVKFPRFDVKTLSNFGSKPKQKRVLIIVAGVSLLIIILLLIASFFVRKSREGGVLPIPSPTLVPTIPTSQPQGNTPSQIKELRESLNNLQLEDSQLQLPQVEFNIKI